MQRHKRPLDFLESPYRGGKRFLSPTLAARRPYLAPTISAEDLNCKWVSPQFKQGECETSICPHKRRNVAGAKRTRKRKAQSEKQSKDVQKETANLFPELTFESSNKIKTHLELPAACTDNLPLRRSPRNNHSNNNLQSRKQEKIVKKNNFFLFSLGSPKSPTVFGEILVRETPENEVAENRLRRLRPRDRRR